ncbi:MAG: hypothetical protein AAFQ57_11050 [Cyanobacteria bacterium J06626_14]
MQLLARRWVFGVVWGVASAIGLLAGGLMAASLVMRSSSQWIVPFAVVGAGLGAGQSVALFLCAGFKPVSLGWLPLTMLGTTIGALLGFPIEAASTIGLLVGLSLGVSQWLLLGKWGGFRSLLWIPVNAIAVSSALSFVEMGLRAPGNGMGSLVIAWAIAILPPTVVITWLMPSQHARSNDTFVG